jgi:hypothetical protein
LGATERKRARVKVVPDATQRFVDDGWLALALFGRSCWFLSFNAEGDILQG